MSVTRARRAPARGAAREPPARYVPYGDLVAGAVRIAGRSGERVAADESGLVGPGGALRRQGERDVLAGPEVGQRQAVRRGHAQGEHARGPGLGRTDDELRGPLQYGSGVGRTSQAAARIGTEPLIGSRVASSISRL
ncbi:hypothetical protein NKH77_47890 [Streptomyces sp. M19]